MSDSPSASLQGGTVFLSASVPTRQPFERKPDAPFQVEQAVISLVRAIFANGGRLVFGGHPSISPLVASVATEYFPARPTDSQSDQNGPREGSVGREDAPIQIYQSFAHEGVVPDQTWDMVKFGFARIRWTEAENGERYDASIKGKTQCGESLRAMRAKMVREAAPISMVAIGGMEGIFAEVEIFLAANRLKPVFAVQDTGGAAECLAQRRLPDFPDRERVAPMLSQFSARGEWPFRIQVVNDQWQRPAEEHIPRDPRDRSVPPYQVIMQSLVQRIAEHRWATSLQG